VGINGSRRRQTWGDPDRRTTRDALDSRDTIRSTRADTFSWSDNRDEHPFDIADLPDNLRDVATRLAQGIAKGRIASELGINRDTVTSRVGQIEEWLRERGVGPTA
jgi:DNA-binding NarL/FixJ family response regulator